MHCLFCHLIKGAPHRDAYFIVTLYDIGNVACGSSAQLIYKLIMCGLSIYNHNILEFILFLNLSLNLPVLDCFQVWNPDLDDAQLPGRRKKSGNGGSGKVQLLSNLLLADILIVVEVTDLYHQADIIAE